MTRISFVMLGAQLRAIDQKMKQSINDNVTLDQLRKQRGDIANQVGRLYRTKRINDALKQVSGDISCR